MRCAQRVDGEQGNHDSIVARKVTSVVRESLWDGKQTVSDGMMRISHRLAAPTDVVSFMSAGRERRL